MRKKKNDQIESKKDLEAFISETVGLERDLLSELQKSKKTAHTVAAVAVFAGLLGLGAGYAGLSQKAPDPVVLRVDQTTGAVERVSIMEEQITYQQSVDIYFVNQFVLNREGYEYNTIQRMYDTTRLMSGFEPWQAYEALYSGPNARDAVLNNRAEIVVRVRSITTDPATSTATVRFFTQTKWTNGRVEKPQYMIATISYTYVRAAMTEEERRINPLGFVVTSYRADPEVISN